MSRMKKIEKASADFEKSMLPQTRRAVFFDVAKLQWRKLLMVGLLLLISALPLLVIAVYEDTYILTAAEDPSISQESLLLLLSPFHILCAVLSVPCLCVFFLGLSGAIRIVRQLAWEEHAMVFPDFLTGFRQNWKQALPLGLLFGLGFALSKIGWYSAILSQTKSVWMMGIPFGLMLFLIAPLVCCGIVIISVYSNSLGNNLKLAAYVYLKNPIKTIVRMLLAFGPCVALWLIPHLYLHLIGAIPAIILFVFALLGWTLFTYEQLDQHYNAQHFPELVGKGLNGQ